MSAVLAQATFQGPQVQWFALSPLLVLAGGGLVLMVLAALGPRRLPNGVLAFVTVTLASAAFVLSLFNWDDLHDPLSGGGGPKGLVGTAVGLDGFSIFVTIVICVSVALVALIADDYLRRIDADGVEFYALLLMVGAGGIVLASANDLVVLFLGLETLSLGLYVLAATNRHRMSSTEAAVKYFVLGSFASAIFLYGIALVYGATGTTSLPGISRFLSGNVLLDNGLLLAGLALLLVGFAFKVGAVPFQWWIPDVYQGSPSPVTALMGSAAKVAAFAALIRVVVVTFGTYETDWRPVVFALAVLSLLVGAVLAVVQTNVKRMLAYSSISHAGFILVGVEVATDQGISSALFYLLVYAVVVAGTFGVVAIVGRAREGDQRLDAYRGLGRGKPVLAGVFTVFLLAQAGIPLTSGFWAKFGVILAAADREQWALAVIAMLASVISAFLYLRIIVSMYLSEPAEDQALDAAPVRVPVSAALAIGLSLAFTLVVGFLPGRMIDFARDAVPVLVVGS